MTKTIEKQVALERVHDFIKNAWQPCSIVTPFHIFSMIATDEKMQWFINHHNAMRHDVRLRHKPDSLRLTCRTCGEIWHVERGEG